MYHANSKKFIVYNNDIGWFFNHTRQSLQKYIDSRNGENTPIYYWNKIKIKTDSKSSNNFEIEYLNDPIGHVSDMEIIEITELDIISSQNRKLDKRPIIIGSVTFYDRPKDKEFLLKIENGSLINAVVRDSKSSIECFSFWPSEIFNKAK